VVPPCSHRVSRVRRYSGSSLGKFGFRVRASHPLWTAFPCRSANLFAHLTVLTPSGLLLPVWPLPRSLATTCGISVDVFSSSYLDVSVQTVPFHTLFDSGMDDTITRAGLPHSEISGSKPMCGSPKLIAACRVLRRLLMPRHSPCALIRLTFAHRFRCFGPLVLKNYASIATEFFVEIVSNYPFADICFRFLNRVSTTICRFAFNISSVQFSRYRSRHCRI
jgi:hypothetical protein